MKKTRILSLLVLAGLIVMCSFIKKESNITPSSGKTSLTAMEIRKKTSENKKKCYYPWCNDMTEYVWFDNYGDWIDLNNSCMEACLTGYDQFAYPPLTLQERGFTRTHCWEDDYDEWHVDMSWQWYFPDIALYSHP